MCVCVERENAKTKGGKIEINEGTTETGVMMVVFIFRQRHVQRELWKKKKGKCLLRLCKGRKTYYTILSTIKRYKHTFSLSCTPEAHESEEHARRKAKGEKMDIRKDTHTHNTRHLHPEDLKKKKVTAVTILREAKYWIFMSVVFYGLL